MRIVDLSNSPLFDPCNPFSYTVEGILPLLNSYNITNSKEKWAPYINRYDLPAACSASSALGPFGHYLLPENYAQIFQDFNASAVFTTTKLYYPLNLKLDIIDYTNGIVNNEKVMIPAIGMNYVASSDFILFHSLVKLNPLGVEILPSNTSTNPFIKGYFIIISHLLILQNC